jgi:hypothetical protein
MRPSLKKNNKIAITLKTGADMQRYEATQQNLGARKIIANAVYDGDVKTVQQYLEEGGNPNIMIGSSARGTLADTPLHVAIRNKNYAMISILLTSPKIDMTKKNVGHLTPIALAMKLEHLDCVRFIALKLGDNGKITTEDAQLLKIFTETVEAETRIDKAELSKYLEAVLRGDLVTVRQGLEAGILGKLILDENENTALHLAIMQRDYNLIKLLMEFNINLSAVNKLKHSAIRLACFSGNWECMLAMYEGYNSVKHGELSGLDQFRINLVVKRSTMSTFQSKDIPANDVYLFDDFQAIENHDYFHNKLTKTNKSYYRY